MRSVFDHSLAQCLRRAAWWLACALLVLVGLAVGTVGVTAFR